MSATPVPGIRQQNGTMKTRSISFYVAATVMLAVAGGQLFAHPVFAQGKPQTVGLVRVDPGSLATGYRASKVVGSTVVNEANQFVGTIDDLIITPTEKVPFAILSVGGFLGVGTKYVAIPYSSLQVNGTKMVLPGATKESLESLPSFKYNT